ncbi:MULTISPECIES: GNAT family N-acetyltransferase [unclassified Brevibacterium]|uniref:GNAT family N-acetyltransferase n=1 Tax=unclassified Brevibacterium TaxID=2614124 RepID=UPI001E2BD3A4|nr:MULTISPECIES: GNAT family N-acetyltransferase [unclassified Brevibacterium]MCD1286992.1 N-acetyltransferase [Brevibacterium sp. CCUG 69071]MDK8436221.1 GNAT family N-acetyltransferase [Brevibacterium sp. H-BE7]
MEITRIRAGELSEQAVDGILAEVLDFDTLINRGSGLGEDFDPLPAEVRRQLSSVNDYLTHTTWIGRLGGMIVAKGLAYLPLSDNIDVADLWCAVHPAYRRQGLGSRLLQVMEKEMRAAGRTRLSSYCELPPTVRDAAPQGAHIAAGSGFGSLPSAQPDVAFLAGRGYSFRQLERCSVARVGGEATGDGPAGADEDPADREDGYVIETWQGPTPEHRLEQIAVLHQKMSTDTPGAAEFGDEEKWDAARVRVLDAERAEKREIVSTALALRGEEAAGFTEVAHFADRPEIGWQGSTLVAREHRGHGLGARLKIANHARLGADSSVERVYTWNAVENTWMLAINDAAGFATWAWVGLWKKNLA